MLILPSRKNEDGIPGFRRRLPLISEVPLSAALQVLRRFHLVLHRRAADQVALQECAVLGFQDIEKHFAARFILPYQLELAFAYRSFPFGFDGNGKAAAIRIHAEITEQEVFVLIFEPRIVEIGAVELDSAGHALEYELGQRLVMMAGAG